MPQARDNSPYNSRRMAEPRRPNNPSPNFGSPCRMCNKSTVNRTQICNNCCTKY